MSSKFRFEGTEVAGSGNNFIGVAGENIANRELVRIDAVGTLLRADASVVGTLPAMGIALAAGTIGQNVLVLLKGFVGLSTWTWTPGGRLYVSDTAGALTQTAGTAAQEVGVAYSATQIWFDAQGVIFGIAAGCPLLEGSTAFVGFDACKEPFTNYFLCDGTADDVQIALALVYVNALGGGSVFLEEGDYDITAGLNVPVDVMFHGAGFNTVLLFDAGGNCITITGDNVKIRDLKIDIVDGAGGAGTRPNGIYAADRTNIEITKVWVIGDETVADDGSDFRQSGINLVTTTFSRVAICKTNDHERYGIFLFSTSNNNTVIGNTSDGNTLNGIRVSNSNDNTITGNTCNGNAASGIRVNISDDNTITGNTCNGNSQNGIYLSTGCENTITGNTFNENIGHGIRSVSSLNNTVSGNTCNDNTAHGITLDDSNNNTLVGNTCSGNDSGNTNSFDGINITDISLDNLVHSNTCNDNDRHGIYIDDVLALRNWIKNNQLRGNTSGPFLDATANLTKLATAAFQFTEAVNGDIVVASPTGIDVDATGEAALAWGQLPVELQQVVRLKIWAVATDAPIGAGGYMHLEVTLNAGASNAAYNTAAKSWNIVNFNGEEVDYVADDVVHWIIEDGDVGNELVNLVAEDSFEIFALWEVGADPDGATDALFRIVEVEYV